MKNIDGETIEIKELLRGENFYRVPEYQRPYSWDEEQFQDLIQDLLEANKEKDYFLGTIVLHKKQDGVNDIVDGQQRLTTIMILLACIRDLLKDPSYKVSIQQKILQTENKVDGIPERIRLEVKDREIFQQLIITSEGTTAELNPNAHPDPQSRYIIAIKTFREKLKTLSEEQLQQFVQFLNQNCVMICLSTSTFDDAFRLFTIVNDRGKQLRRIDILKANNIAPSIVRSDAVRNSLAQKWEDWEKTLGGDEFEDLFYLLRFIYLGEKPNSDLLVEFEEKIFGTGLALKGERFVDTVCDYAALYNELFVDYTLFVGHKNSNRLISLLYIMNCEFKSNEWKAALMLYIKKFQFENLEVFLYLLELKYLEGWVNGLNKDNRTIIFGNVIKIINSSKDSFNVVASPVLIADSTKITSSLAENLYGKSYCKYILLRLELLATEHDVEKKIHAKSIEHVLPQNPKAGSQWETLFSVESKNHWVNKLANLVLLSKSKNSAASNYEFDKKKDSYLHNRVSDYPRSIEILAIKDWTPQYLEQRQAELIGIALKNIFE